MTRYLSTRGGDRDMSFEQVLLGGLARDGGLYLPETWPGFTRGEIAGFRDNAYAETAFSIARRFIGDAIPEDALARMIDEAYGRFDDPQVAPVRALEEGVWLLELFHGPTLAFKDIAMQLLGPLMEHVLRSQNRRATIVGATSGDTGGAAIEAFRGLDSVDVFILHPHQRVTDVQRRQMTTVSDKNVHNIALRGNFDDCQTILKRLFNDHQLRDRLGLAGVNSINWARVMAQITYYFTAAAKLGAPEQAVSFTVPTGNFGDIFAGFVAKRMGLEIDRLVIATNVNDILERALKSGTYQIADVVATTSPSMDIQISSNFERLLFEASNRDASWVKKIMDELAGKGRFSLPEPVRAAVAADFDAGRADEGQTRQTMKQLYETSGMLIDPHTAVGLSVARSMPPTTAPMVVLSTAHPAKFPDAVKAATGIHPPLPDHLADLMTRPERFEIIDNDLAAVSGFITANARATRGGG